MRWLTEIPHPSAAAPQPPVIARVEQYKQELTNSHFSQENKKLLHFIRSYIDLIHWIHVFPFGDWVTCKYVHKRSDMRRNTQALWPTSRVWAGFSAPARPCVSLTPLPVCSHMAGSPSLPVCVWQPAPHSCTNNMLRLKPAIKTFSKAIVTFFWAFWQRTKIWVGSKATLQHKFFFSFSTNHWFSSEISAHDWTQEQDCLFLFDFFFVDILSSVCHRSRPPSTVCCSSLRAQWDLEGPTW